MPELGSPLHLDMYEAGRVDSSFAARLKRACRILLGSERIYGMQWGDPDSSPPLTYVRNHFLAPYLGPEVTALEIGPGGGRWTRYLLRTKRLYAVDFHQELLDELRSHIRADHVVFVRNNGSDFPGVPPASVDFVFTFGTFVHLDVPVIDAYLRNLRPILAPAAVVVIQYSDKNKPIARKLKAFSANDPDTMRRMVLAAGYRVYEEDTQTLWHSSVIRFGIQPTDPARRSGAEVGPAG